MKRKLFLLILIVCLLLITGCQNAVETQESSIWERREVETGRITAENTPVYAGPGYRFNIITTLSPGEQVDVLSELGNWYIVRLDNDYLGSIEQQNAQPIVPPDNNNNLDQDTQDPAEGSEVEEREEATPVANLNQQERQLLDLVNRERELNNRAPLEMDPELTRVARIKSEDMEENNYFSHYSPEYGSPFDMLDHFGVEYLHAGENIAGNPSIENAHNSLMNSPGHRQNILNENYTKIGIGITESRRYGYLITQLFISQPR